MKRRMVIYRGGIRYWASKWRTPSGKRGVKFWSSHDWPFYHASYVPDIWDANDLWRKFLEFIPEDA